jgi:hypothetical protein
MENSRGGGRPYIYYVCVQGTGQYVLTFTPPNSTRVKRYFHPLFDLIFKRIKIRLPKLPCPVIQGGVLSEINLFISVLTSIHRLGSVSGIHFGPSLPPPLPFLMWNLNIL